MCFPRRRTPHHLTGLALGTQPWEAGRLQPLYKHDAPIKLTLFNRHTLSFAASSRLFERRRKLAAGGSWRQLRPKSERQQRDYHVRIAVFSFTTETNRAEQARELSWLDRELYGDGSASVTIRGGMPLVLQTRVLLAADGGNATDHFQREEIQFYPGEVVRQGFRGPLFNGICAGCRGSISGSTIRRTAPTRRSAQLPNCALSSARKLSYATSTAPRAR